MTAPAPFPLHSMRSPAGLRSQATGNDMRAERLVREVRSELGDLRRAFDELGQQRDDMVEVDLERVVAHPDAAATLPPPTLVNALLAASDRIKDLEREVALRQREEDALRDRLASLQDDYAYTRGRLETLHDVIAALHGNLEDLRYDRDRGRIATSQPRLLHAGSDDGGFGMQGQRGSGAAR